MTTQKITISRKGLIAIETSKTYAPVGRFYNIDGMLVGRLINIENRFETSLDDSNSTKFELKTVAEVRNLVKSIYGNY